jgi:hypothetical protein
MKKIRGDKSNRVITHIYMQLSQGTFLCSYLYLIQGKIAFFFFFFYKIRKQEGAPCLVRVGLVQVGRESWWGKGV